MMEIKACHGCHKDLGSSYYADVPGKGDLCLVCWTIWFNEQSAILQEQERKEPDGDGELHEFIVVKEEIYLTDVYVSATTPDQAREIVRVGGGEDGDSERGGIINEEGWNVVLAETPIDEDEDEDEEEDDGA